MNGKQHLIRDITLFGCDGDTGFIENATPNTTVIKITDDLEIKANFSLNIYELEIKSTEGGKVPSPLGGVHEFTTFTEVKLKKTLE